MTHFIQLLKQTAIPKLAQSSCRAVSTGPLHTCSYYLKKSNLLLFHMDCKKLSSGTAVVVTIDVDEAKDLIHSGHRFLDVRTEEEFRQGHLENSLNIPYMFDTPQGRVKNPNFLDQVVAAYSKQDHLVVGCRSGVRSLYAVSDLMNEDFKHVSNMGGGYIDWVQKGFAVKKPAEQEQI